MLQAKQSYYQIIERHIYHIESLEEILAVSTPKEITERKLNYLQYRRYRLKKTYQIYEQSEKRIEIKEKIDTPQILQQQKDYEQHHIGIENEYYHNNQTDQRLVTRSLTHNNEFDMVIEVDGYKSTRKSFDKQADQGEEVEQMARSIQNMKQKEEKNHEMEIIPPKESQIIKLPVNPFSPLIEIKKISWLQESKKFNTFVSKQQIPSEKPKTENLFQKFSTPSTFNWLTLPEEPIVKSKQDEQIASMKSYTYSNNEDDSKANQSNNAVFHARISQDEEISSPGQQQQSAQIVPEQSHGKHVYQRMSTIIFEREANHFRKNNVSTEVIKDINVKVEKIQQKLYLVVRSNKTKTILYQGMILKSTRIQTLNNNPINVKINPLFSLDQHRKPVPDLLKIQFKEPSSQQLLTKVIC